MIRKIFILLVLFECCFWLSVPVEAHQHHKQVLMITSYHHGDRWNDDMVQGVRDIFESLEKVDLVIEHLDMRRNMGEEYEQNLASFLWIKYRKLFLVLIGKV